MGEEVAARGTELVNCKWKCVRGGNERLECGWNSECKWERSEKLTGEITAATTWEAFTVCQM